MMARVKALIETRLADAMTRDSIEIVRKFAIPIQSLALTCLLNAPESEAGTWISWGTHGFRDSVSGEPKDEEERVENEAEHRRALGCESLTVDPSRQ